MHHDQLPAAIDGQGSRCTEAVFWAQRACDELGRNQPEIGGHPGTGAANQGQGRPANGQPLELGRNEGVFELISL